MKHGDPCAACLPQNVSRPFEEWFWTCAVCGRREVPFGATGRRGLDPYGIQKGANSWCRTSGRSGTIVQWCSFDCMRRWHEASTHARALHIPPVARRATRSPVPARLVAPVARNRKAK